MSHTSGEILKDGERVGYFEYNGTADVCLPNIWGTLDEVEDHWRDYDWERARACGHGGEPVTIYSHYGDGFYWPGRACLSCMVITDGLMPYDDFDSMIDGEPPRAVSSDLHEGNQE